MRVRGGDTGGRTHAAPQKSPDLCQRGEPPLLWYRRRWRRHRDRRGKAAKNSVASSSIKPHNVTASDLAGIRVVQVTGRSPHSPLCSRRERLLGGGGNPVAPAGPLGASRPGNNGWFVEQGRTWKARLWQPTLSAFEPSRSVVPPAHQGTFRSRYLPPAAHSPQV
jgi:hypothetical protein